MYFGLDTEDTIYGQNNKILYRLVAEKDFKAVDPYAAGMLRGTVTVHEGDKGGYAESIYCLEEKIGLDIKPWAFPCSAIYAGSLLSGASAVYGGAEIMGGSVIDSGCVIIDSRVDGSTVSPKKVISHGDDVLVSCIISRNSVIEGTSIQCDNVSIALSSIHRCDIRGDYGNIRISNAELESLSVMQNVEIRDSAITGGDGSSIGPNLVCRNGEDNSGMPSGIMVKYGHEFHTHEDAWKLLCEKSSNRRGIYVNVQYSPLKKGV